MQHVLSTMLPKQLSGKGPAPAPRADVPEGYVLVKKPSGPVSPPTPPPSPCIPAGGLSSGKRAAASAPADKDVDVKHAADSGALTSVCGQKCIPVPARAFDPNDPLDVIRQELLQSRLRLPIGVSYKHKQYYQTTAFSANTLNSGFAVLLNPVGQGSTQFTRIGNRIRCLRLQIMGTWQLTHIFSQVAGEPNNIYPPNLAACILQELVPLTPGTAAGAWATDSFPPGNTVSMFSFLGRVLTTRGLLQQHNVENPAGKGVYKCHKYEQFGIPNAHNDKAASESGVQASVITTITRPQQARFEWDIDLHGMITDFDGNSANIITNAISYQEFDDGDGTTPFHQIQSGFSSILTFEDV